MTDLNSGFGIRCLKEKFVLTAKSNVCLASSISRRRGWGASSERTAASPSVGTSCTRGAFRFFLEIRQLEAPVEEGLLRTVEPEQEKETPANRRNPVLLQSFRSGL